MVRDRKCVTVSHNVITPRLTFYIVSRVAGRLVCVLKCLRVTQFHRRDVRDTRRRQMNMAAMHEAYSVGNPGYSGRKFSGNKSRDTLTVPDQHLGLPVAKSFPEPRRADSIDSGRGGYDRGGGVPYERGGGGPGGGGMSYHGGRRDSMETYQRRQETLTRQNTVSSSGMTYSGTIPRISSYDYDDPYGKEEEILPPRRSRGYSGHSLHSGQSGNRSYTSFPRGYSEDYEDYYEEESEYQRSIDAQGYERWSRRPRGAHDRSEFNDTGSRVGSAGRHRAQRPEQKQVRFQQPSRSHPVYDESRRRRLDSDSSFSGSDDGVEQLYIAPRLTRPEVSDGGVQYQFGTSSDFGGSDKRGNTRRQQEYFDGFESDHSNYDNSREGSASDDLGRERRTVKHENQRGKSTPRVVTSDYMSSQTDYVIHEPYGEVSMYGREPDYVPPVPSMQSGGMLERYLRCYGVDLDSESTPVDTTRSTADTTHADVTVTESAPTEKQKMAVVSRPPRPPNRRHTSRGSWNVV